MSILQNRIIGFVIILLILSCNSCQYELKNSKQSLKVATFNCQFLWDGLEPEEGDPSVYFRHKGNKEMCREHMADVAQIIKIINADVINLVEVENYQALQYLNDSFLFSMNYNIGFVEGEDHFTGQDVAILSKHPIRRIYRYTEKGRSGEIEKSVSKNYIAEIEVGDICFVFIGIHLLSGPMNENRVEYRQAQADALSQAVNKKYPEDFHIVIFGDMNDYDEDSDCLDINDHRPISKTLAILKGRNGENSNIKLCNIMSFIPKKKRYTSHYDMDGALDVDMNELSAIDHILVTEKTDKGIISADIYHDYNPLEISDHYPVMVILDLNALD